MAILLCLIAGAVAFTFGTYRPLTLVIQARSLEKGERFIQLEDRRNRVLRKSFVVGSADGDSCMYPVELPPAGLRSVTIPPLATAGKYELEGFSLGNDDVTYHWDSNLVCSQRLHDGTLFRNGPCDRNAPQIALLSDNGVAITSIPEHDVVNPFRVRMAMAAALGVLLSGLYLLRPGNESHNSGTIVTAAVRGSWLLVIGLFIFQLLVLVRYAVDLPYYEEWEFFDTSALPGGLSWHWLSMQVSHQRMMVFTKLLAWLDYKLFSLDFVKLKIVNYAVFGTVLLGVVRFKKKVIGAGFPFFSAFMIFLLSPIAYEVHSASFQSGETFAVLFSVLMLSLIITDKPSWKISLLFSLCAVGAMCSLSAGLVYALILLISDTVYSVAAVYCKRIERAAFLKKISMQWGVVLPAMLYWFHGFKKPEAVWGVPSWLLPNEGKFWEMFFNLLSFCFGFEIESPLPGIICLLFLLCPVILLLKDTETRWEPATWQVISALAGSLAVVGLITIGRGNMGFSIKVSRYAIFGMLLIPYAAMAWWLAFRTMKQRCVALTLLWLFCAASYRDDWDYGGYRNGRQQDLLNLECVEKYHRGVGNGLCEGTFLFSIGKYFDAAKKLDVQFTRQFTP